MESRRDREARTEMGLGPVCSVVAMTEKRHLGASLASDFLH